MLHRTRKAYFGRAPAIPFCMHSNKRVRMVKGPAAVTVHGSCRVLGCDVSNRTIRVRAGKALPFEPADQNCSLRVKPGRGGRAWWTNESSAGTSMWTGISEKVLSLLTEDRNRSKTPVVMLAGKTDTGKSAMSTYLANATLARGYLPCVIDGDIGQTDLAPPGCIGVAQLTEQLTDLRDESARLYEFVGRISPAGIERLVSAKLRSAVDRAYALGDLRIVNTDGYVAGESGTRYKRMVAEELQPEIIVCLGKDEELVQALRTANLRAGSQLVRATSSMEVQKSRVERIRRRRAQFLRHVKSRKVVAIELSQIQFIYMDRTFAGSELLSSAVPDLEKEYPVGTFVGLGSNNRVTGFGVIAKICNAGILVRTSVRNFDLIYLSDIKLEENSVSQMPLR